jgi:hypothetical protein
MLAPGPRTCRQHETSLAQLKTDNLIDNRCGRKRTNDSTGTDKKNDEGKRNAESSCMREGTLTCQAFLDISSSQPHSNY